MSPELLQYVQRLSLTDQKSLTQKALKLTEECGELAKKVLPYEGAFATNHRIFSRESVLEEVVDVTLCALSIAHSLKFTQDEITSMMFKKAEKWDGLQQRERGVSFPVPFEIHVTVELGPDDSVAEFRQLCERFRVKPIILDLQDRQGVNVMNDVMTSSKHIGTNTSALAEANAIAYCFFGAGKNVVRTKIETVPWHPAAPQVESQAMPPNCYFEAHIPVILSDVSSDTLYQYVQEECLDVHMSQNIFKVNPDGSSVIMLTHRTTLGYGNRQDFEEHVDEIKTTLMKKFQLGSCHMEFALYDTKVSHDASWLK